MRDTSRVWFAALLAASCTTTPLATSGEEPAVPPSASPAPSPSSTGTPASKPSKAPASDTGTTDYAAPLAESGAGDLADWAKVAGPSWLNGSTWTVARGVWQLPTFSGAQWAFRRYAGDAFGPEGRMPALYQFAVKVRPKAQSGQIVIVPYYLDPTHYEAVVINLDQQNVSLVEYTGGTPTSGSTGTVDLSQKHRGWRPLPAPDADGAYTIRVKVNTQWHSLAVWVEKTWIDTPLVPVVDDKPHWVAIRSNGTPQEILAINVHKYTDPYLAR